MTWQELPTGQDIQVTAPNFFVVVAQVSTAHSKTDILAQAAKRGLNVFDYNEGAPGSDGYRQVALQAQAMSSGSTIPWSPGFPASLVAHYSLTQAWWSPPTTAPTSTQPAAASASGVAPAVVVIGLGAAAGLIWWLLRRR